VKLIGIIPKQCLQPVKIIPVKVIWPGGGEFYGWGTNCLFKYWSIARKNEFRVLFIVTSA